MKLTVLVDNNTLIDRYFLGEAGLSFFIEDGDIKILFDTGYSDAFLKNANKLNINLLKTDYIVLSHGHLDHTWGLSSLVDLFTEALVEGYEFIKPKLLAHPKAFATRRVDNIREIGSKLDEKKLSKHFDVKLESLHFWLSERLLYLGEIERKNDFEAKRPLGEILVDDRYIDDYILDDTAIVYKSDRGLVIITGCSHSGICNIVEQAKSICDEDRVIDIIGGLHLLNPNKKRIDSTIDYIEKLHLEGLHACHCTDLHSKIALSKAAKLYEVGSGLRLEYK